MDGVTRLGLALMMISVFRMKFLVSFLVFIYFSAVALKSELKSNEEKVVYKQF